MPVFLRRTTQWESNQKGPLWSNSLGSVLWRDGSVSGCLPLTDSFGAPALRFGDQTAL